MMSDLMSDSMRAISHAQDAARDAVSAMVVLFAFGAVLLALAGDRMEKLELEVAARPARTFALGLVGFFGLATAFVVLCVTVIGIPFAILGALLVVFAAYAGIVAVLGTLGGALIGHRTKNTYLHLAAGCTVFLVIGHIPWIGDLATLALIFFGVGAVLASRVAGLWPRPKNGSLDSYAL